MKAFGQHSSKLARDMVLLARLYVRNRHPPADNPENVKNLGFVKGRELLDAAQSILTSDELSVGSMESDIEGDSDLGNVYHYTGMLDMFEFFPSRNFDQLDNAIVNAERAIAVWDSTENPKAKADTLNLLGSLNMHKGMSGTGGHKMLMKAESLLKESLALRETILSRTDPDLGQVLNTLGDFYTKQGNLPDAEGYYHRARRVYVEGLGPRHTRGVFPLIGLATLEELRPEKDFALMIRYWEQVVSIRKQLGDKNPQYQQSFDKLRKARQQQFIQQNAATRISRLWKKLKTAAREGGASGADGNRLVESTTPGECTRNWHTHARARAHTHMAAVAMDRF